MQRLPPLVIGLLMAVSAVLRVGERAGLKKITALGSGVTGYRNASLGKWKIIGLAHFVCVCFASSCIVGASFRAVSAAENQGRCRTCQQNQDGDALNRPALQET